jgi:hypothetical protein
MPISLSKPGIRGAINVLTIKALEGSRTPVPLTTLDQEGAHRFIHYDPFQAKVWELDGLESGPVEVWRLLASRMHRKDLFGFNRRRAGGKTKVRR